MKIEEFKRVEAAKADIANGAVRAVIEKPVVAKELESIKEVKVLDWDVPGGGYCAEDYSSFQEREAAMQESIVAFESYYQVSLKGEALSYYRANIGDYFTNDGSVPTGADYIDFREQPVEQPTEPMDEYRRSYREALAAFDK